MKLVTFGYTDLKGKNSVRSVVAIGMPTNKLSGIDVGELSEEEVAEFYGKYQAIHEEFIQKAEALKEEFDLKHKYRQFLETGIKDLETVSI